MRHSTHKRQSSSLWLLFAICSIMLMVYTGCSRELDEDRMQRLYVECLEDRPWALIPAQAITEQERAMCNAWAIGAVYGNGPRY